MKHPASSRMTFKQFYATDYRADHQHPANLALHIIGVMLGLGLIVASLTIWPLWTLLGFPVVHAAPGLIGHRFFDRDEAVGDVRLRRTDFPLWWFIVANHMMTAQVLTARWSRATP
jgi:hypothetical protein